MQEAVRDKIEMQQAIANNKVKTPTMVRWSLLFIDH